MTVKPRLSGLIGQHIKAGEAAPMPTRSKPPAWIFVVFLFFGLPLTGVFGYLMIWRPLRVNLIFVETTCVVLDKKLERNVGENGITTRPLIHIEYEAGGRIRQAWTYDATGISDDLHDSNVATLARFTKGQRCPCWYDPNDPDNAVLTRSFSSWSLMLLIPLTFAAIGAGGLIYNRPVRELTPRVCGTFSSRPNS